MSCTHSENEGGILCRGDYGKSRDGCAIPAAWAPRREARSRGPQPPRRRHAPRHRGAAEMQRAVLRPSAASKPAVGPRTLPRSSGQDVVDHSAVDVSQTEVAAGVTIRPPLVIQPREIQQRGVQVVPVDLVFDREMAEFVGGAVGETGPAAADGRPLIDSRQKRRTVVAGAATGNLTPCTESRNRPPHRSTQDRHPTRLHGPCGNAVVGIVGRAGASAPRFSGRATAPTGTTAYPGTVSLPA